MKSSRVRKGLAGLLTLGILIVLVLALKPGQPAVSAPPEEKAPRPPRPSKPIAMPARLTGLEISLGLTDTEVTPWGGSIEVTGGKLLDLAIVRGNPQARVLMGKYFQVRTIQPRPRVAPRNFRRPVLRVCLDAPPTAEITVRTRQGNFSFKLGDLALGQSKKYFNGRAAVERQEGTVRLTGPKTEDDYPVLARGRDGTAWLAYVEYQPGQKIDPAQLKAGKFDSLVPKNNGDQIILVRFDGKTWAPPLEVTGPRLRVWRPTVAVDGKGRVVVAWSQQVDGDWEIFYRRYTPPSKERPKGQWSDTVRLTHNPGSDFGVVAATDAAGTVWLAWQSWQKNNFDILAAALEEGHPWEKPRVVSHSPANDWSPAIAADSRGNVFIAWDTYDKGNYDVLLATLGKGKEPHTITVAGSAKFEARPHLVCDGKDRVWIAYEEGDEQWGKDYANQQFRRIGLKSNPGFALYIHRTVRVKCLADGKLMRPAANLQQALARKLPWNRSMPRLAVDRAGAVWLLVRHHPPPTKQGEVWDSYVLRYDGTEWSAPAHLPASSDLMDNRPALLPLAKDVLVVHSSDSRMGTQNRGQDDLFAGFLREPSEKVGEMRLVADQPDGGPHVPVIHPHEDEDVARLRAYRVEVGGKKLHLLRGEFHRHTELSSHGDGDGMLEDGWRYALDPGRLDWIGIGDHDNGFGSEYMWWHSQKMTELHHNPPAFVGVHTYERSVVYPNGHRNVLMPHGGVRPLPRGDMKGTAEKGTPDTKVLYAYLKHFGAICASHTSATDMGTDWRDNDPDVEPVVEIYQGHRHNYETAGAPRSPTAQTQIGGFRPAGFVWNAFAKGYRFGFQCSSDHISTHMSFAVVLTDDLSPPGIIKAFRQRHCYGANDNILLDVRSGDHLMGDAFTTAKRPTLDILVHGTGPVAKVWVVRDNKYVYTAEPGKAEVKLRYTDMDAKAGKTSYYYVRIEQADGSLAWASPMWITYQP